MTGGRACAVEAGQQVVNSKHSRLEVSSRRRTCIVGPQLGQAVPVLIVEQHAVATDQSPISRWATSRWRASIDGLRGSTALVVEVCASLKLETPSHVGPASGAW